TATGLVGLGHMGSALAANLVAQGHRLVVHDALGPDRAVDGSTFVPDVAAVARQADVVVLSLPDGTAVEQATDAIVDVRDRGTAAVVDTSTIGVAAAERVAARMGDAGLAYVDAPVSGGVAGARARTLAVMYAGDDDACARTEPVLAGLSDRRRRVG